MAATKAKNTFLNKKLKSDGLKLLAKLADSSIKIAFFDPQYRGILDKMSYGNEGKKRGKERSNLAQMDFEMIEKFIIEIERVLKPSGYLFLWIDKFHLVDGVGVWLQNTPNLNCVDLITWDKGKIGMGYRTRRKSEYLLVIQKNPKLAKSTWSLHDIPDVWCEKIANKTHTHQKPLDLQAKLIAATTNKGDIVLDPASGSFSVLKCCKRLNIDFIGCDIEFGEIELK